MFQTEDLSAQPAGLNVTFIAAVVVLALTALYLFSCARGDKNDAVTVPGLPLLGNALALGRHGVSYLRKCRQKFGDAFSVSLAGVKMTFLFEPAHIDYFFSAPDEKITFRPAVEQFTQRVFGLTSRLFFPLHFKMLTELRHLLVPGALELHMQLLGARALQLLPSYVHHDQVDLWSLCRGLVFHCAVEVVFGRPFLDQLPDMMGLGGPREGEGRGAESGAGGRRGETAAGEEEQQQQREQQRRQALPPRPPPGVERLARVFFTFEEGFELAASPLPHVFQSAFVESRTQLLRVLREADRRGLFGGTPAGQLLDRTTGLPPHLRANLLLALMWASQANTVPAVFWSTAFLLLPENAEHKAAVVVELQKELQSMRSPPSGQEGAGAGRANGARDPTPSGCQPQPAAQPSPSELVAAATRLAANRRSAVSRCVAEALRLRVQSIDVRQAAAQLELPSESLPGGRLRLPRGRLLAVCPFESHHDRKLCAPEGSGVSDPWVFDPLRPDVRLGDGGAVVPSLSGLAFGGGPYRCPGRFFAEQELGLLVQLFLWLYDMALSYGDAACRSPRPAGAGPADAVAARPPAEGVKAAEPAAATTEPLAVQPAATAARDVDAHPHLRVVKGGSLLYRVISLLLGSSAMAWGFGWFDGLDGPMQEWRESGDPAGLLPPCDLRRLVGVKVPRKPCWVQLSRLGG